ncbi:nucleoside triphosphate pyrophosphohydrolase [Bacillus sp. FSL W7-1360]
MPTLSILGLGAGELSQLPLGLYRTLKQADILFVRTADHPVLIELAAEGVQYVSFDEIYERHEQFEDVYKEIASQLLQEAQQRDILYAVPGHPFVAERTVQLLHEQAAHAQVTLKVLGGASFLDAMYSALAVDPIDGCQIVDGTALKQDELQLTQHIIIVQVYDALIASDVKLTLMARLPDDYEVIIATAVGTASESITRVPLYALDRHATLNNLTAVYVPPVKEEVLLYQDFAYLRRVIATLRGPNGCPWDRKQTHMSLKKYLLEEAYEVFAAIDEEDDEHLVEELGDVLLQVLLHAQIGEDEGYFSVDDVIGTLTEKMIRRHPHVFAENTLETADEVAAQWEEIKKTEQGTKAAKTVPKSLPALMRAEEIVKRTAVQTGVWAQLTEQLAVLHDIKGTSDSRMLEKSLGEMFIAVVQVARHENISPEMALQNALDALID